MIPVETFSLCTEYAVYNHKYLVIYTI